MARPQPLLFLSPLHRAIRQIGIHLTECMRDLDMQPSDGHLVSYLRSYAPVPISEIARVFGTSRSTLTSQLDRLEARGLLRRDIRPEDRRSFEVSLTKKGRTFAERVQRPVTVLERNIRARVTEEDLDGFRRVMDAIAEVTGVEVRPQTQEKS